MCGKISEKVPAIAFQCPVDQQCIRSSLRIRNFSLGVNEGANVALNERIRKANFAEVVEFQGA